MLSAIRTLLRSGIRLLVRCMTRVCLAALSRRRDTGRPSMAGRKAHLRAMQEYHQKKKGDTILLVNPAHSVTLAQEKNGNHVCLLGEPPARRTGP